MKQIFICFVLCLLALSSIQAQQTSHFYYHLWLHAREIAYRTLDVADKYPQIFNNRDFYLAGVLTYKQQPQRAICYWQRLSGTNVHSIWAKAAMRYQQSLAANMIEISAEDKQNPRLLSELAVLLYENGKPDAWRLAYRSLLMAQKQQLAVSPFWHNLLITCPADRKLWHQASKIVFANSTPISNSPLYDPRIYSSLAKFSQYHDCKESISKWWEQAWQYAQIGYFYQAVGQMQQASYYWEKSLGLYQQVFVKGQRGNLSAYRRTSLIQMSRVFFACKLYEPMLFYLYRPDHFKFVPGEQKFRVALQFLSAHQIVKGDIDKQILPESSSLFIRK